MDKRALQEKFNELIALSAETETVEFKEAKNTYDFTKLGKYFSALANEANLNNRPDAWLVMGVKNNHTVVGTAFRISLNVANQTGQKAEYSKNRALNKEYYVDLIKKSIHQHGHLERKDIDELLWTNYWNG